MGQWLTTIIGGAAQSAGTHMGAHGAIEAGKAAYEVGRYTQLSYLQQARAEERAGGYEAGQKRKEGHRIKGTQITEISAKGGTISGTNLQMIADTAAEIEADAYLISQNARRRAGLLREKAGLAKWAGSMELMASRIRAAGIVMQGISGIVGQGGPMSVGNIKGKAGKG